MSTSLIGKRLGNYDIQSLLGEGGMGAVYLGLHPQIGKKVAIKVLHEELCGKADVVARFFNEAKAVNDINHPNIVDIIDFGETTFEGSVCKYIIMEYLDGESLAARIRRDGVTIRETLSIISQCASALAASHAKGVVHRDLKPENVYLCNRSGDKNYTKLLDFGIAKLTSDSGPLSQKTRTGMVIGTPTYMSPEQCDGKGNIDHRADIYALGVMMYELLTGRVPFPGEGFGEVLVAHLTREPEPPRTLNPNIPPEIEAIVLRCLRKQREARFQSMNDMLASINDPGPHYQAWLQGQPAPVAGQQVQMNPSLMAPASMIMAATSMPLAGASMVPGGMMPMGPMGTGPNQAMRGGQSAVWSAVSGPMQQAQMQQQMQMQQMQMQQMQMQQQMQSQAMIPVVAGGQPGRSTGMGMAAPGMSQPGMQGMQGMGMNQPGMQGMGMGMGMGMGTNQPGMGMGQPGMGMGMNQAGMSMNGQPGQMGGQPRSTGMMVAPQQSGMDQMPVAGFPIAPRSTTLSGASAETSGRRPVSVLLGFAGAIVFGILVVVTVKLVGGKTASATNKPVVVEEVVSVRVVSDPPQAEIVRGDQGDAPIGKTPYTLKLPKGGKPVDLKLRLTGYRDEARSVTPDGDQTVDLTLSKVPAPTPDPTPDPTPEPVKPPKKTREPKGGTEPKIKEPKEPKEPKTPKGKEPVGKDPAKPKKKKKDGDGIMAPVF